MPNLKYDENGFATESGWERCHCCDVRGIYQGVMEQYVSINSGLPAGAYLDAPPPFQAGVWPSRTDHDSPWATVPDLRGNTAYNIDTKEAREITEVGPLRERETLLQPSSPYDGWDGFQWVADHEADAAAALAAATATRSALLAEANQHIDVLSDAVDLGMATADEQAAYNAWRRYRVELTRLDLTAEHINWPKKPT